MSDEDPWKGWYQEQPPAGAPGSDATHDMTISSRMPRHLEAVPARAAGGVPGPTSRRRSPLRGASDWPYGGGSRAPGYGGGPGYGPPYGTSTAGGAPTRGGGRRWRFWGQPGRHGRRIALIIGVVVLVIILAVGGSTSGSTGS